MTHQTSCDCCIMKLANYKTISLSTDTSRHCDLAFIVLLWTVIDIHLLCPWLCNIPWTLRWGGYFEASHEYRFLASFTGCSTQANWITQHIQVTILQTRITNALINTSLKKQALPLKNTIHHHKSAGEAGVTKKKMGRCRLKPKKSYISDLDCFGWNQMHVIINMLVIITQPSGKTAVKHSPTP